MATVLTYSQRRAIEKARELIRVNNEAGLRGLEDLIRPEGEQRDAFMIGVMLTRMEFLLCAAEELAGLVPGGE